MTTSTSTSDVPLPPGTHTLSTCEYWGGDYRIVWGADRPVPVANISLAPHAVQLRDGTIDDGMVEEPPGIAVDEIGDDGRRGEHFSVTIQGGSDPGAGAHRGGRRARRVDDRDDHYPH